MKQPQSPLHKFYQQPSCWAIREILKEAVNFFHVLQAEKVLPHTKKTEKHPNSNQKVLKTNKQTTSPPNLLSFISHYGVNFKLLPHSVSPCFPI